VLVIVTPKFKIGDRLHNKKLTSTHLTVVGLPDENHPRDYVICVAPSVYPQLYPAYTLELRYEAYENGVEAFMRVL
jgi:hypothetical protein